MKQSSSGLVVLLHMVLDKIRPVSSVPQSFKGRCTSNLGHVVHICALVYKGFGTRRKKEAFRCIAVYLHGEPDGEVPDGSAAGAGAAVA